VFIGEILAYMTQVSDVAPGPLVICLSIDGTYYGIAFSVHLCGPCKQDKDRTVSSRNTQVDILDHHNERKNPMNIHGQRSKVIALHVLSRKSL
jgi:hypothetical protein